MKTKLILCIMTMCVMGVLIMGCGSDTAKKDEVKEKNAIAEAGTSVTEGTGAGSKSLVVYFSWSGNTEFVADEVAKETGADVFRVVPADASRYGGDYDTVVDMAKKEVAEQARPKFAGSVADFEQYDTIYLGYPCWWGDMPMIMYSFLAKYDLSGKTLATFTTNEGSGFGDSLTNIQKAAPKAKLADGLQIRGKQVESSIGEIKAWVDGIKTGK